MELVMLKVISVLKMRFDIMSLGGINFALIADSNALIKIPVTRPIRPYSKFLLPNDLLKYLFSKPFIPQN